MDTSDIILSNFHQTFLRSLEGELRQLTCAVVQSLQTSGTVDLKTWHSFSSYMVKKDKLKSEKLTLKEYCLGFTVTYILC